LGKIKKLGKSLMNKLTKIEEKINSINEKIKKIDEKKKLLISQKKELEKNFMKLKVSSILSNHNESLMNILGEDNFDILKNQLEVK
jgi:predicted nuclease with TOPRIM domain